MRTTSFPITRCVGILLLLAVASPLVAQTTQPAPQKGVEAESIRKTGPTTRTMTVAPTKPTNLLETQRVVLGLALVLALIFGMRWVTKRFFPSVTGNSASGAVRVLARTPVTPKQQILLIQVGQRVLVVSDNGVQMNSLSQITDADEVALLIGQLANMRGGATNAFGRHFGKAERDMEQAMPAEVSDAEVSSVGQDPENSSEPQDAKLVVAQGELEDLAQKVRGLARHIGR